MTQDPGGGGVLEDGGGSGLRVPALEARWWLKGKGMVVLQGGVSM